MRGGLFFIFIQAPSTDRKTKETMEFYWQIPSTQEKGIHILNTSKINILDKNRLKPDFTIASRRNKHCYLQFKEHSNFICDTYHFNILLLDINS